MNTVQIDANSFSENLLWTEKDQGIDTMWQLKEQEYIDERELSYSKHLNGANSIGKGGISLFSYFELSEDNKSY